MKVLVGALAGLVLGAAIVAGLTVAGVAKNYWPILVVAVVAGMAMGKIASGSRAKYLKGGLAAVATALAMIVGQIAAAQILSKQVAGISSAPPSAQAEEAVEEETDAPAGDVVEELVEEVPVIVPVGTQPAVGPVTTGGGDVSPMDIGFFAIGCLIAYQLGKGGESAPASTEEASDEPAADPGEEPQGGESEEE